MIKKITSLLVLACTLLTAAAQEITYKNPTGKEFPILAWCSLFKEGDVTHQRYEELRNAGFNLSFSFFANADVVAKALDACTGTGVKLIITCGGMAEETAAVVNRFKGHAMTAGWFLRDEPRAPEFGPMREFRDRVYAADTTHIPYLNLFPNYVEPSYLGTSTYEEYVERFMQEVPLPMISYDYYPVMFEGDSIFVRPLFYDNLETIRHAAQRHGVPFWAFVLSTAHDPYPLPTAVHMRFEAFSALAYGAQCIQYFTYWHPGGTVWNFHNAPISRTGRRTHIYYLIKDLNREIQTLAPVFLGAHAADVWHTGSSIPKGTKPLATPPAPFTRVEADGQGVLVSHLVNGDDNYLMIVNRDIHNAQHVTIATRKAVKRILPNGTRKRVARGESAMQLAPGDYLLYIFNK